MIRSELRYAIWVAYGKKDAYSIKLIEHFEEMEVDHIIPKSTPENILREKIALYGLGPTFTLDAIENLVPTFKGYNRQKSGIPFNESSDHYFLGIAQGKSNRVRKELSKVVQQQKQKEKIQFKKSHRITHVEQYGFKSSYFNSDSLVALNAYLPSVYDEKGSCAIEFYEMGTMIALNHELILSLAKGFKENVLEEMILNYYNETTNTVFVIIGTSSLHFKREAYDQLLKILTDFLQEYDRFMEQFVRFWHLANFEPFKNEDQYKLLDIEKDDWGYLIAYTHQHDIDKNKTSEIMFHANVASLIAVEREPSVIKFFISRRTSSSGKILLIWHLPPKKERRYIKDGAVWHALQTLDWLKNVLSEKSLSKSKFSLFSKVRQLLAKII